ncbi:metallophosphoesterase [Campylobacter sp. RM16188]|uniref:metallophosphoesterase family protein n=1 Tax=Campylobacter sp. RM16188 TaxID=1705725 RepID=UPI00155769C5|nr:metallophosphoesterase [Campylobacter sp. RM16188]
MKILHTTDLHFNEEWFSYIKHIEKEYDVICITGDLLDAFHPKGLDFQIDITTKFLKSLTKPTFVCSGNHDVRPIWDKIWLNEIEGIYSDSSIEEIDKVKFGCAAYYNPNYEKFKECDILLSHLPPSRTPTSIELGGSDYGSRKLYYVIGKGTISPKFVLSGHIHNPIKTEYRLKDAIIYNPGCDKDSKKPGIIRVEI